VTILRYTDKKDLCGFKAFPIVDLKRLKDKCFDFRRRKMKKSNPRAVRIKKNIESPKLAHLVQMKSVLLLYP
jgi:hypothetical protein